MWVTMHHLLMSSFAVSQDTAWDDVMEAWIDRIWCTSSQERLGVALSFTGLFIDATFFFMSVASKITITIITTVVVIVNRPFVPSVSTEPRLGPLRLRWWFPHRTPNQREWHKMKANTIRSNKSFISLFPTYIPPQKKTDVFEVATLLGQITLFSLSSSGGYHVYIHIHIYKYVCINCCLTVEPRYFGYFFHQNRLQTFANGSGEQKCSKYLPFLAFCWCQRGGICWELFAKTK